MAALKVSQGRKSLCDGSLTEHYVVLIGKPLLCGVFVVPYYSCVSSITSKTF